MTLTKFIRTALTMLAPALREELPLIMLALFVALMILLHFTDNTEALATCQASHSIDVCEFTLNP